MALPGSEAVEGKSPLSMGRAQKALGRRDESGTHYLDPATPL